jgi:hypothetical protein
MKNSFVVCQATDSDLKQVLNEIQDFNMPHPEEYYFTPADVVFVAKKENKILGFVVIPRQEYCVVW